jgi:MFS family permease
MMQTTNPEGACEKRSRTLGILGPLAERDFLLFWAGQSISKLGNGIYTIGLAWAVYQLTSSTAAMGVILAANAIPELALAVVGGAVADRWLRRSMIMIADTAACLVTLSLAIVAWSHSLSVPLLATGAFLLGVISAFYGPAYSAMNRDLLQENQFGNANTMLTVSVNAARVLGPAAAGAVFALGSAGLVFAVDAATFAMRFTRTSGGRPRPSRQNLAFDLGAGLRYTLGTRWLRLILAISLVVNFACLAPYFVLLPDLVKSHHRGVGTLSLLTTIQILASISAALLVGKALPRIRPRPALIALAAIIGVGALDIGFSAGTLAALMAGAALIGVGLAFDVIENTLIQVLVPAELLSRVYSVNMVVSYALLPLGYATAGLLGHFIGSSLVFVSGGIVLFMACCAAPFLPAARDLDKTRC